MLKLLAPPARSLAKTARDLRQRVHDTSQRFGALSRPAILPDAVSFLDPIDELCEEVPPRFMQSTYYVVVAMFISLLLIASLVKVDIIVSGTGRLTTATPPIMLQAMDQAIIRELPVQPGDTVTKGQVLATLDPTFAQADVTSLTSQQQSLQAQIRRLEAELNGTPFTPRCRAQFRRATAALALSAGVRPNTHRSCTALMNRSSSSVQTFELHKTIAHRWKSS